VWLRRFIVTLLASALPALATAQGAPPATQDTAVASEDAAAPPFELTVDVTSRYVWRGYDLSHGDPTLLAYLNYYAESGFWANVGIIAGLRNAAELGDEQSELDEVDATVGWEWGELAGGSVTAGVAVYAYKYTSTWTRDVAYEDASDVEANLYLTWDAAAHLRPTLEYYYGLDDNIQGYYLEAGLVLPFAGESWSFEPKLTAAWSSQYDVDDRMTNATVTLPLSFSVGPATITPSLQWVWVDDPESFNPQDLVGEAPEDTLFVGTVRVAFTF
jgi:hypothetical protein